MNRDLLLAVLAMDAYGSGQDIGTATFIQTQLGTAGFAVVEYLYNGETIVSFRGTDIGVGLVEDILNGWPGGTGGLTSQAHQAVTFAQTIFAGSGTGASNVTFTGHSLGGGLAGLVAGFYGQEAVIFDNMAFRLALNHIWEYATDILSPYNSYVIEAYYEGFPPWVPNTSEISGYRLDRQILNFQSEGQLVGVGVNWGANDFDIHSQALLVLTMYAEQTSNLDGAWKDVTEYLGPALLDLSSTSLRNIAYSVVSEDIRPAGDAAAHSLFDDAADIANFVNGDGSTSYYIDWPTSLAEIAVQFAARQADNAITVSSMGDESSGVFHETAVGLYLSLDSATNAWGSSSGTAVWGTLRSDIVDHLEAENGEALSTKAIEVLDNVDFVLLSAGGAVDLSLDSENPMVAAGQVENVEAAAGLVFGTDDVDNIIGGKGKDFLIGGGANDVLVGGDGVDALFGGEGADILITGNLNGVNAADQVSTDEVIVGGAGTDYLVLSVPERPDPEAEPHRIEIEGGDKADRLLIHRSLIDAEVSNSADTQPLMALLGGVAGTVLPYVAGQTLQNSNLGENEAGEKYRGFGYDGEDYVLPTFDGTDEVGPRFWIGYNHYFEANRLEIVVFKPGLEPVLMVVINDFQPGDYGIKLSGPFELYEEVIGSSPGVDVTISYNPLPGMGSYNAAIEAIRSQEDDFSLNRDGSLAASRLAMAALAAPDESWHMALSGDDANNILNGNDVSEHLSGADGNDVLSGAGGTDKLLGGNGNDRLIGGTDADVIDGGSGVDTADYRSSTSGVVVSLLDGFGVGGDAEGDAFVAVEHLAGSAFADTLTGDHGINRIQGMAGNDSLFGGDSNDRLLGGEGADLIDGGAGVDTADYSTSRQGVSVNLTTQVTSGGDAAGDSFAAIENLSGSDSADSLTGDAGNNRLSGVDGDDMLSGMAGIDYLVGGAGDDVMTGGTQADVFVIDASGGHDTITDFWAGAGRTDRVQLVGTGVMSFADVSLLLSQTADGAVLNLNGGAGSILFAGVSVASLVSDDFIFV